MNGRIQVEIGRGNTLNPGIEVEVKKQTSRRKERKTKMNEIPEEMSEMGNEAEEKFLTLEENFLTLEVQSPPGSGEWVVYRTPQLIIPHNGRLSTDRLVFTVTFDNATGRPIDMQMHIDNSDAEQEEGKGKESCL